MIIGTGNRQPFTQPAPFSSGGALSTVFATDLVLKYPGNTAGSIENKDVKLSLDADNMLADQWNGATFDNVNAISLPNT